jgi:hypothetical protein
MVCQGSQRVRKVNYFPLTRLILRNPKKALSRGKKPMTDEIDIESWLRKGEIPHFPRFSILNELDALAQQAHDRQTPDSCLGAVLIYHQIADEILRLFVALSDLWLKLKSHPIKVRALKPKSKAMFGKVMEAFKLTIDFPHKAAILRNADDLNAVRIALVHKLTHTGDYQFNLSVRSQSQGSV